MASLTKPKSNHLPVIFKCSNGRRWHFCQIWRNSTIFCTCFHLDLDLCLILVSRQRSSTVKQQSAQPRNLLLGRDGKLIFSLYSESILHHVSLQSVSILVSQVKCFSWKLWASPASPFIRHLSVQHSEMGVSGTEGFLHAFTTCPHQQDSNNQQQHVLAPGKSSCPVSQSTLPSLTLQLSLYDRSPWKSFPLEMTQQWIITSMQKGEAFHNPKRLLQTLGPWICWQLVVLSKEQGICLLLGLCPALLYPQELSQCQSAISGSYVYILGIQNPLV